jgi:hypothetical protein
VGSPAIPGGKFDPRVRYEITVPGGRQRTTNADRSFHNDSPLLGWYPTNACRRGKNCLDSGAVTPQRPTWRSSEPDGRTIQPQYALPVGTNPPGVRNRQGFRPKSRGPFGHPRTFQSLQSAVSRGRWLWVTPRVLAGHKGLSTGARLRKLSGGFTGLGLGGGLPGPGAPYQDERHNGPLPQGPGDRGVHGDGGVPGQTHPEAAAL